MCTQQHYCFIPAVPQWQGPAATHSRQLGSSTTHSRMSWFTDFFKYEIRKGFEDPKERQKAFEDRLDAALVKQDAE